MKKLVRWVLLVCACCVISVWTIRGSNAQHAAHLSDDLGLQLARQTSERVGVIIPGSDETVDAIAARHSMPLVRRFEGGAVVLANSAELAELAADGDVTTLSGDADVRPWMSVSKPGNF